MIDLRSKPRRAPVPAPTVSAPAPSSAHAIRMAELSAARAACVTRRHCLSEQAATFRAEEQVADSARLELLLTGDDAAAARQTDTIVRLRSQIDGHVNASRAIGEDIARLDAELHALTIAQQREDAAQAQRQAADAFAAEQGALVHELRQLARALSDRKQRLQVLSEAGRVATAAAQGLGVAVPNWSGLLFQERVDLAGIDAMCAYHEALVASKLSA